MSRCEGPARSQRSTALDPPTASASPKLRRSLVDWMPAPLSKEEKQKIRSILTMPRPVQETQKTGTIHSMQFPSVPPVISVEDRRRILADLGVTPGSTRSLFASAPARGSGPPSSRSPPSQIPVDSSPFGREAEQVIFRHISSPREEVW